MVCASAITRATSSAPWVGEANRARWSGVVDFEDIRLEEDPPDVPRQHYGECWIYSVTGSGTGAQAGICFVADEVVYKRIEKPQ